MHVGGRRVARLAGVHHEDVPAGPRKNQRRGQASGTSADHHDVALTHALNPEAAATAHLGTLPFVGKRSQMSLVEDTPAAAIAAVLDQVPVRLKRIRTRRKMTLTEVADTTGISKSTLSRLPTSKVTPEPRSHDGHEWIYVLSGRVRFILADQDLVLGPGEVAAFDTTIPHWFGSTGEEPGEILSICGRPGERMIVRVTSAGVAAQV